MPYNRAVNVLKAFLAGAIAVPIFHQGMLAILNASGIVERAPFSMQPTEPFAVPQIISISFWGGVWGILMYLVVRNVASVPRWWIFALLFGTLATTLVAGFVVAPLKGQPIAGGGDPRFAMIGLLVNGAWALGTAILLRFFGAGHSTGAHAERVH